MRQRRLRSVIGNIAGGLAQIAFESNRDRERKRSDPGMKRAGSSGSGSPRRFAPYSRGSGLRWYQGRSG
jgi:hypothetical protein